MDEVSSHTENARSTFENETSVTLSLYPIIHRMFGLHYSSETGPAMILGNITVTDGIYAKTTSI